MKPDTLFSELVNALQPGAGGRAIATMLGNKVDRTTALGWRRGHRAAPKWALHMLADELERRARAQLAIASRAHNEKERVGMSAGALNLRKYHANKNR